METNISSRTPEGEPNHCPVCGQKVQLEPSYPTGDAPCPNCGTLLWFNRTSKGTWFVEGRKLQPIFDRVRTLLAKYLHLKKEEITLATTLPKPDAFAAETGTDSLDLVEIVMRTEEEFGLSFTDADAEGIQTVWDLCVWILKHQSS
jgi:acyl carrier protein